MDDKITLLGQIIIMLFLILVAFIVLMLIVGAIFMAISFIKDWIEDLFL